MTTCRTPRRIGIAALLAVVATNGVLADDGTTFFEKHIRPVLVTQCYTCHSDQAKKARGGLRLDTRAGLLKGGDTGPAIVPGHPDKSLLVQAVRHTDTLKMPPEDRLTKDQIASLAEWVAMGAPDPRTGGDAPPAVDVATAKSHWAFRPLTSPAVPTVRDTDWPLTPVDCFILAPLETASVVPAGPADRHTLIRRATYGVTGLPPTTTEVETFNADSSPDAFAKVIDRLLDSQAYGEHWGRHWLDLARYADTSGCNSDFPVPTARLYRDYVVASFNADKPYDRFVREQVAGDLLPASSDREQRENLIATGYLATARRFGSANSEHHLTLEDAIDNLGKVVLGLSLGCARCHDHKYDPVPAADYYALYGILNSTRFSFPGTELFATPRGFVALGSADDQKALTAYEDELFALSRRFEALQVEKRNLSAKVAAGGTFAEGERTVKLVEAEMKATRKKQDELRRHPPAVERAYGVTEGKPADARVQLKGDPKSLGAVVARGYLQVFGGPKVTPAGGSGRRELADWLTDPVRTPVTARVIVNRVWQYTFGRGLVATPNNFGARGKPPSHPELLDYLTSRFVAGGWSVKSLLRMLLLSRAYQMASVGGAADDPANERVSRFARRRLSAEELRDSLLFVAGTLERGPSGRHPFPPDHTFKYTQHAPFVASYPSNHRGLYLMQQRWRKNPFLDVFDGADPNATTAVRPVSTSPLQALFHMNGSFAHEQAAAWAASLATAASRDETRIDLAYRAAFARPASPDEVNVGLAYLTECRRALADASRPETEAWASYARVLLASNEFAFVE